MFWLSDALLSDVLLSDVLLSDALLSDVGSWGGGWVVLAWRKRNTVRADGTTSASHSGQAAKFAKTWAAVGTNKRDPANNL
jgi:hypothetical protein